MLYARPLFSFIADWIMYGSDHWRHLHVLITIVTILLHILYNSSVDVVNKLASGVVDSCQPDLVKSKKLLTDVTYVFVCSSTLISVSQSIKTVPYLCKASLAETRGQLHQQYLYLNCA